MRIALIGHACAPDIGSEPGITWNWATALGREHEVTLLTHPHFRAGIEAGLARFPSPGLTVQYVAPHSRFDRWRPDESGERGIRFHYLLWQRAVLDRLMEREQYRNFQLLHHVSWGTLQQSPVAWKTGLPFVWGPVGGGQRWPAAFMNYCDDRPLERIRNLVVKLTPINPMVKAATRAADLAMGTNHETTALLRRLGARRVEWFPDYGTLPQWMEEYRPPAPGEELLLLWAGRCESRKGLPLVLEALAGMPNAPIRLLAAGDGPLLGAWREQAQRLGIGGKVEFLGRVPSTKMKELFARADVFVFPSLRESFGTVMLEALARGLPVVTFHHQGAGALITPSAGIRIPLTTPAQAVNGLTNAFKSLVEDRTLVQKLRHGALELARQHLWMGRVEKMNCWYEDVLATRKSAGRILSDPGITGRAINSTEGAKVL
jgi:glycosyltransferase involved in cell wall biosynthesis